MQPDHKLNVPTLLKNKFINYFIVVLFFFSKKKLIQFMVNFYTFRPFEMFHLMYKIIKKNCFVSEHPNFLFYLFVNFGFL